MAEHEQPLAGGNSLGATVRVGDTVRKAWTDSTPAVIEFMAHVRAAGVDVPEVLGRDELGRQVLEFIPGRLALDLEPLSLADLSRAGALIRSIHEASAGFVPSVTPHWSDAIPSPGADLICHGDLTPWNLMVGERWVFVDWDGAAPSTRLWDLAYSAQAFALNDVDLDPGDAAARLGAFVDGYGADAALRVGLPQAMTERVAAMCELLRSSHAAGAEPWATMYVEGHGAHWRAARVYVERHRDRWASALLDHAG